MVVGKGLKCNNDNKKVGILAGKTLSVQKH